MAPRPAKPTMGVKNFHKEFMERNGYDAGGPGIPQTQPLRRGQGSVALVGAEGFVAYK